MRYAEFGVTLYSRRIDKKNRLIYKVEPVDFGDNDVVLLQCKGHYGDKQYRLRYDNAPRLRKSFDEGAEIGFAAGRSEKSGLWEDFFGCN